MVFPSEIKKMIIDIAPNLGNFPKSHFSNFPRSGEFLQSHYYIKYAVLLFFFNES